MRSALKDFSNEFEKEFKESLIDWQGLTDDFKSAKTLIIEDFSFIITSEVATKEPEDNDEFSNEFQA